MGEKEFSVEKVSKVMKDLWNLRGLFSGREVGKNLYVFRFTQGMDLDRVMRTTPLFYGNMLLALIPHNGVDAIAVEDFKEVNMWAQIHGLSFTHLTTTIGYSLGVQIERIGGIWFLSGPSRATD